MRYRSSLSSVLITIDNMMHFARILNLHLEYDLALVVHSAVMRMMKHCRYSMNIQGRIERGVMHCFSYDQAFADHVIKNRFVLGIGGTVTYPKNADYVQLYKNAVWKILSSKLMRHFFHHNNFVGKRIIQNIFHSLQILLQSYGKSL